MYEREHWLTISSIMDYTHIMYASSQYLYLNFYNTIYFFYFQMDYFCAFSVVMYSLLAFLLRAIGGGVSRKGGLCGSFTTSWISITSCIACLTFFILHIYRMAFVHFDYGYNMKVYFKGQTNHYTTTKNLLKAHLGCIQHDHK